MGGLTTVLLDALGTLVELEPPAPHLLRELGQRGVAVEPELAREAMRAEIAHYRREHHRAGTDATLAVLRRECAGVLQEALGPAAAGLTVEQVEAALLASVRFTPFGDVAPALRQLRADGARLVVVSNWDVSLHHVLAQTGLSALVDGARSSAEAGAPKPAPDLLEQGLALVGGQADDAVMVGDSVTTDVGAAQAARVVPVLLARGAPAGHDAEGVRVPDGVRVLEDLGELPGVLGYLR